VSVLEWRCLPSAREELEPATNERSKIQTEQMIEIEKEGGERERGAGL
jgi:hypothetical protein